MDEIISNYDKMYYELSKEYECLSDCNETHIKCCKTILTLRLKFIDKKKENEELLELYKARIYLLCDHSFVDDEIDITSERTQKITYCSICESTKK
jgi:hypothetical protein